MPTFRCIGLSAVIAVFAGALPLAADTVTCSSEDGGRHHCDADSRDARVRMVNQRSGSRCEEGYSWGTDDRGIWVDHGCRADFEVSREGFGFGGGRSGRSGTLTCSSEDGGRHHCDLDSRNARVRMVNQRSGSRCEEGYSWGTDDRGVWVDHGCRADFAYESGGGRFGRFGNGGSRGDDNRERVVNCSDESGNGAHCDAPVSGGVELLRQRSGSACRRGYSWGVDQSGIWVSHGCRADFVLRGVPADR